MSYPLLFLSVKVLIQTPSDKQANAARIHLQKVCGKEPTNSFSLLKQHYLCYNNPNKKPKPKQGTKNSPANNTDNMSLINFLLLYCIFYQNSN